MKILKPLVFLLICLTRHGSGRSTTEWIDTEDRNVDGGSDGLEVESPPQWTMVEEGEEEKEKEEEEPASLRESIAQAVRYNRSQVQGHGSLPTLPAGLVTYTQLTFLDLVDLYLPNITKVNPKCRRDLIAIYTAMAHLDTLILKRELWPLKLVDSWGKFSDGLMVGNLKEIGFFKECLDITVFQPLPDLQEPQKLPQHHPDVLLQPQSALSMLLSRSSLPYKSILNEEGANLYRSTDPSSSTTESRPSLLQADFTGQYCLVTYASAKELLEAPPHLRTPALSAVLPVALTLMAYGTCMPSSCTREELLETVDEALQEVGLKVSTLDCQVKGQHHPLQGSEITGIFLLVVLVSVMGLASLADLMTSTESRQHLRNGPLQYLLAFSVIFNLKKMMHLETRKLPGVIPSINGIRFLSILWVVLGHQYAYSAMASQNIGELPELSKPIYAQIVTNADLSVDTFFMLSGLLVTVALLGMVKRAGRFSLPLYVFHRLLRLWPPVALTVILVATVSGLTVSGPYAEQYWNSIVKGCRHSWWMDISLTNNLIYPFLDRIPKDKGEAASCLPHTWYLGVDIQLYLIMPLLLLPLLWWPRRGWLWLGLWTAASVITPAAIVGAYHLWPASLMVIDPDASLVYNHKVYLMPWCRAGPYLVGAWAGYLIYYSRSKPSITHLKIWQAALGWMLAVAVSLAVLFGIAPYNYVGTPSQVPEMSTAEAVMYGGAHRAAWGAAVAWVIVACTWGYGGPVAWILEHSIWQPLSRLSYCIYLTSLPIQLIVLYSIKRPTYYSLYSKMEETAGVMVVVVAVSICVSLASESPTLRLEKILLQKPTESQSGALSEAATSPPQQQQEGHENNLHSNSRHNISF